MRPTTRHTDPSGEDLSDSADRSDIVRDDSEGLVGAAAESDPSISEFHKQKLRERREVWQINPRLAAISAVVVAVVLILGTASYFYNSNAAAQTFRLRAEEAAGIGDAEEEARWWSRYLMMVPNDADALIESALAADRVAEQAESEELSRALAGARRRLSDALARLPEDRQSDREMLRRMLIGRLLQSGGYWLREAENQIKSLNAKPDDVFANKALALAIYGQVQANLYDSNQLSSEPAGDYWQWLSRQNPSIILQRAVQVAPDDLDAIAAFLSAVRSESEIYKTEASAQQGAEELSDQEVQWAKLIGDRTLLVDQSLEHLDNTETGRARLIRYFYDLGGDAPADAQDALIDSAPEIAARLQTLEEASDGDEEDVSSDPSESEKLVLIRRMSPAYWDYQCLLEAARLAAAKASGQLSSSDLSTSQDKDGNANFARLAEQWYNTLMSVSVVDVTAKMRENTFLYAGMYAQLQGDSDRAIEIWKRGLEAVSLDNLELSGAIATQLATSVPTQSELGLEDSEEADRVIEEALKTAENAVEAFGKAIQAESARLLLSTTLEMTDVQRNAIANIIEMARWRYNVASAQLQIRRDGGTELTSQAIAKLKTALASTANVRPQEKAQLATNLASLYAQHEVWDLAADALSTACDLFPNDTARHVLAGEAWTKAGNRSRAAEHWRLAGKAAEIDVRVRAAQAEFNFQLRMPPAIRDFSGLRTTVEQLEKEFSKIAGGEIETPLSASELEEVDSSLRILKMSLPPLGILAEQHLASRQMAVFADELAAEKQDNASIQAYAAERLSAVGMNEKAAERIDRLEEILGKESTPLAIVKARIDASNGKSLAAAKSLIEQLKSSPQDSDQLARLAANYALASRDLNLAYDALKEVPSDRRLPSDLYQLYRQAKQIAGGTEDQTSAEKFNAEADEWFAQLKLLEEPPAGDDDDVNLKKPVGTFWRMIEVENNLARLRAKAGNISRTDKEMIRTRGLLDTILGQRPRWGRAISMRGYLSAVLEHHEEAVEQLRSGIAAGDRSLRTRQLLLEQLITLGRDSEADEEMKRMAMSVDFVVDPYAKQDIRSAFNRGELLAAVDAARQSMQDNPADATPLVVFSRVASTAVQMDRDKAATGRGKSGLTEQQREELVQEAREAIAKAKSLATENELALAAAALDIEFRHGTPESVDAVFEQIDASDLPENQRLLLSARVSLSKGDIDLAIEKLRQSNRLLPSLATQVQLATLYQAQGRSIDVVQALRDAVKMQPENQGLRSELAKAIVIHEGDQADWDEVEQLLSGGDGISPDDKFIYATLLAAKGNGEQLLQALGLARELVREQNSASYEASVLQVTILVKLVDRLDADEASSDPERRQRYLDEARNVCQRLANARAASAVDLYRYGALLLKYGDDEDLKTVKSLSDQLRVMPSGMLQSLELGIIYNQRVGSEKQAADVVEDWVKDAKPDQDRRLLGGVESAAGRSLMNLGLIDEGLKWYEKAYQSNEDAFASYILALSKAQQYQKAADVAAAHYEKVGDAVSATLLVENLLALDPARDISKYSGILSDATDKHGKNAELLESVATLAMQRGTPQEAIKLYQKVLSFDALRIRALNNLAMAYAQVPGLAAEGLVPIDRAIKLTKRNPELLDTKGAVLLKAKRPREALVIFDEALAAKNEPRFLFHKILALIAVKQQDEARKQWDTLDLDNLDPTGLTKEEQQQLEQMKSDFETFTTNQI
ncbi:hypothetical protein NZK35_09005 [Stieleria sp. ICT_E10.1]|uniref:hypothetical protein n=1 Tax=Stieleria sedimenti TaxID=2976331 RepID=UPI0021809090|nr:hypothetical protein [Stieleria sedimenti]MCS7466779.1 hypothetical protein [Stieleria sedimenti]